MDYIVKSPDTLADMYHVITGALREWEHLVQRKQAEEQINIALAEKETLLRELYHRTRNNMQLISSILSLHAANSQHPEVLELARTVEHKIRAMALVHEKLYQSHDLSRIDLRDYFQELSHLLMDSYELSSHRVTLVVEAEPIHVLLDIAIPCGLILNELMSNALKHAFPDGRPGEIHLRLRKTADGEIELHFSDNGVGIPTDCDLRARKSIGFRTIFALAEHQLHGIIEIETRQGLAIRFRFEENLYRARV